MSNITNVQESIKRLFGKTYNGQELCCNDVVKRYPQYSFDSTRSALNHFETKGFLRKRTTTSKKGHITYYSRVYGSPELSAYKKFINELKPTEPRNPRLWA